MHLSYIPQLQKTLNIHRPFVLPCWITNPLHSLFVEHRVLFIHTPQDLPEDIGAAIINEIAVFDLTKTLVYSQYDGSVTVIKRLIEQLCKVENLAQMNMRLSKDLNRFRDSVKVLKMAPLYINDIQMSAEDLLEDVKNVVSDIKNERKRHRIVVIDDFLSLKGMMTAGVINRTAATNLKDSLQQLATDCNMSFVVMSRKPLKETFPVKAIQKAFVTIEGKEYVVETIMTD